MENMRHVPTIEQKIAVRDLKIEAGKIIDFENIPTDIEDEEVIREAVWDDGDTHYELTSVTVVDPLKATEDYSRPFAMTLYQLCIMSDTTDREEFYAFNSADHYVRVCDEEWDELDMDDDESQVELSERLMGYLKSYNRISMHDRAFGAAVMDFVMSSGHFYHMLKKSQKRNDEHERFTRSLADKHPVLDAEIIKDGIKRFLESKPTE